jgi:hypothetical protein
MLYNQTYWQEEDERTWNLYNVNVSKMTMTHAIYTNLPLTRAKQAMKKKGN